MPGIEHAQIESIDRFMAGEVFTPDADLMDPGNHKTPNQRMLAAALALLTREKGGATPAEPVQQALDLFSLQGLYGHMALGRSYSIEQGAPFPHDELWMYPVLAILLFAQRNGNVPLLGAAQRWLGQHLALCAAFWTPAGVRMPCSRAKAAPGQRPDPEWPVDSFFLHNVGEGHPPGLASPGPRVPGLLRQLISSDRSAIRIRSTEALLLALPVRRWPGPGPHGWSAAAFVADEPNGMADPMGWVKVGANGQIVDAGQLVMENWAPPTSKPLIIGLPGKDAPGAPTVPSAPAPAPTAPPPSPPAPAPAGANLEALARAVERLELARGDSRMQTMAAAAIREGAKQLAGAMVLIAGFGIGPGQAQAKDRQAILDRLRELAG
jgi:hypothetical protein